MFENMVDMKKSPMEMEGKAVSMPQESVYPYGLSITLDTETLQKLGLDCGDEECQVGNYLHLNALAEVTGYHKSDTGSGEQHTLNLQITHLSLEDSDEGEEESDEGEGRVIRAAGIY
jgi:hypothetical protein